MMGFGLNTFIDDNHNKIHSWSERLRVRILVIHPLSQNCEQRDKEERDALGTVARGVERTTRALLDPKLRNFEIKWYKALPVTNILRMDDVMWVGPYFVNERSRNTYVLKLAGPGELFRRYQKHFDDIWNDPDLSFQPTITDLQNLSDFLDQKYGTPQ